MRPSLHMIEQPAYEVADHVRAQCPAGSEVSEDPRHVGYAGEHRAAIGDRIREDQRLAVDGEVDVAEHIEIETLAVTTISASRLLPDFSRSPLREAFDFIGDDRRLARADRLEQIAIRDEGDALPPWPIASE